MLLTEVIKRPILTEKTYKQMEDHIYTFRVDYHANKNQIKNAVESIFQVKVDSVNTIKVGKKPKSLGRFHGFASRYKKAIVSLKEGHTINFFPNDELQKPAEEAKVVKKEVSEVEKRVAAKLAAKSSKKTSATKAVKNQAAKKITKRKVGGE